MKRLAIVTVAAMLATIQPQTTQAGSFPDMLTTGFSRVADSVGDTVSAIPRPSLDAVSLTNISLPEVNFSLMELDFDNRKPCCDTCCPEFWEHRDGVIAEFLLISANGVDLPYAEPVDGPSAAAIPTGSVATIDPDHSAGFRIGAMMAIDSCSSFSATFTNFQSHTTHNAQLPGGSGFLRALTTHPSTTNVFTDSLESSADYDIDFRQFDLDYRSILCGNENYVINYLLGFRYAHLDQDFSGDYIILGSTNVATDIDFDGIGPRLGFEGAKLLGSGFLLYSKASANFLVGDFNADYRQTNIFAGTQAVSGVEDDRIVSVLEWEFGMGWESCCGGFRATAGYYVAAWFNTLTTPEFIRGVQTSDYDDMSGSLSFDGLTIRTEIRF